MTIFDAIKQTVTTATRIITSGGDVTSQTQYTCPSNTYARVVIERIKITGTGSVSIQLSVQDPQTDADVNAGDIVAAVTTTTANPTINTAVINSYRTDGFGFLLFPAEKLKATTTGIGGGESAYWTAYITEFTSQT